METEGPVAQAERQLRLVSAALTDPLATECLLCYVQRMLTHGCDCTLRWATYYRDRMAPRVLGLEKRLGSVGGFCDCEIFMNGFQLAREHWVMTVALDDDGEVEGVELSEPDRVPPCRGARKGSTKGCSLWVRQRRRW
jgi:hypothetical protein